MKNTSYYLWIGLCVLTALTPLGLIARGAPWGEWAGKELKDMLGFIPEKLRGMEKIWKAPFTDYSLSGHESTPLEYIISALIGITAVFALSFIVIKALGKGPK